jgi:outer membrane protein OmpA-like peptidoglycan-associated protein
VAEHRRVAAAIGLLAAASAAAAAQAAPPTVPFRDDVMLVTAVTTRGGDLQGVMMLAHLTPDAATYELAWEAPDPSHPDRSLQFKVTRIVRRADIRSAHRMNALYGTIDPAIFPGATGPQVSAAVLADLKANSHSEFIFGMSSPDSNHGGFLGALASGRKYFRGTLTRVGMEGFPVLLNGARVELPALRARGRLAVGADAYDAEFIVLDDSLDPIVLRWALGGTSQQIVEIRWPAAGAEADEPLVRELAMDCRAEVHGIYFAFNSAAIQPASDGSLARVAAVMRAQPSWNITIEGHTDSVGTASANLALSARRSEAVKEALVSRGIAAARLETAGRGAGQPRESNATLAGRARNRRVELIRHCENAH